MSKRVSTGIPKLDKILGGGLIPGTMTLVLGATGIGKTHLGISFAHKGIAENGHSGIIFDMLSRGDSQNHEAYSKRLYNWQIQRHVNKPNLDLWQLNSFGNYFQIFEDQGKKIHRNQMSDNEWHQWQVKMQGYLDDIASFFYHHFISGVKRVVVDGVEPVLNIHDSAQHELFDYLYHKVIKAEDQWLAREVFRENYLKMKNKIDKHPYNEKEITTLFLQTTEEVMLEDLIKRKAEAGGLEVNANTIILMGKEKEGNKIKKKLYISKHRGSYASDDIYEVQIQSDKLEIDTSF